MQAGLGFRRITVLTPRCLIFGCMGSQYTLEMTDDRARRMDKAAGLLARDDHDDPPKSKVIDAALTHLLESAENIDDYRHDLAHGNSRVPPSQAQKLMGTSIMGLHFRTSMWAERE